MLVIERTKKQLKEDMNSFIWDFKISDNISYNLNVLFELVDDYNNLAKNYKKPISIIAASIVEAIMIDLLYRLFHGTNHFPDSLKCRMDEIKSRIKEETKETKIVGIDGKIYYCSILKNFNFAPMIGLYKELKLIGDRDSYYDTLLKLAYFRNRVHINNYFNNFEKDEKITFSEKRTQSTLHIMAWFFTYFRMNYSRPWSAI